MHDVFVSYSHRDHPFATRLRTALTGAGKTVWLDEEDIPPASRWADDLKEAIEQANAFVFVMSPDSVASPECRKELDHAAGLNKRIIPIQLRESPVAGLPPPLGSRQFVPPRGAFEDDFDRSLSLLVGAVDTDLEWVREHTAWGNKAVEWEGHERDRSFLLSGTELASAERFLATSAGHEPSPTQLQNNYVIASRQATTRRQRSLLGGVSAALLVALGLAAVALVLRAAAVSNEQTAQSRQAAASSEQVLGSNPELSTLLAVAGLRVRDTAQSERALRDALPEVQVVRTLSIPGGEAANEAAFSPDGREVVTAEGGSARIFDVATGRPGPVLSDPGGGEVMDAAFSPDGKEVATVGKDRLVRVFDAATGRLEYSLAPPATGAGSGGPAGYYHVAWGLGGSALMAAGQNGYAELWDVAHRRPAGAVGDSELAPLYAAALDAGSGELAVGSGTGEAVVYYTGARNPTEVFAGGAVTSVDLDRNGSELVTADGDGTAKIWQLASGRLLTTLGFTGGPIIESVAFDPSGDEVVTAGHDGTVQVWDTKSGRQLLSLSGHTGIVNSAVFSPGGGEIVTAGDDGTARIWDAEPREARLVVREPGEAALTAVAFGPGGTDLATASAADGSARVYSAATGAAGPSFEAGPGRSVTSVAFAPGGGRLLIGGGEGADGEAWVMDLATGAVRRLFSEQIGALSDVAFDASGSEFVSASEAGDVQIWRDGRARTLQAPDGDPANSAVFSADGRYVLVASQDGTARVWNATTGQPLGAPFAARGRPADLSAAFDPSGREIVTAGSDGVARVFDLASHRQVQAFAEPGGASIADAAFDPSGTEVVTADDDGTARIWSVATGQELTELGVPGGASVVQAVFDLSGNEVATVDQWGFAVLWSTQLAGPVPVLERLAGERAVPGLTPAEERQYLAGIPS